MPKGASCVSLVKIGFWGLDGDRHRIQQFIIKAGSVGDNILGAWVGRLLCR